MKAPSTKIRFAEAQKLLDYGFSNYSCKNFGNENDIIKTINVSKGVTTNINAVLQENSSILVKKGQESSITQETYLPDTISAPVNKGDIIGYVEFKLENQVIKKINIVSDSEVKSANLWNITTNLYKTWFNMLRI